MPKPAVVVTPSAGDILRELKKLGTESYRNVMRNHGTPEPYYGTKIEDMKKIVKRTGKSRQLALDLFDTGVYDARYLAGLVSVPMEMTREDLEGWVRKANCPGIWEYTVAWVAAESRFGRELALEWIESDDAGIASCGWATLSSLVSITPDERLSLPELKRLLGRVRKSIKNAPNRVRYTMNGFVMAVGCYVEPLVEEALKTAGAIGNVEVDMGKTACKVPDGVATIEKVRGMGRLGKKRKTAFC